MKKSSAPLVYSPDGKQIAVGSLDNRVRVWDTASGNLLYELQHDSNVADVSYSPDGRVLASASKDATVRFWDTQTGKNLFILRGFKQGLQQVAYLDQGKKLLLGQLYDNIFQEYALDDQYLPVEPLDLVMETGIALGGHYEVDATTTVKASVSPDTQKMAVVLNDNVQIWDLENGESILTLPGYNSQIYSLEFNPDGSLLAIGDHDVHLWQVSTHTLITTLPVNAHEINDIAFRPESSQVAVVANNGDLQIWDTISHQKVREDSDQENWCNRSVLEYSPDGAKLATAGWCGIRIWDAATGQLLQKLTVEEGSRYELAFSEDGSELICVGEPGIWRWNLMTGEPVYSTPLPGYYSNRSVALGPNLMVLGQELDGPFRFFNPINGQHLYDFAEGRGGSAVALHPNERLFARSDYYKIFLGDSASGREMLLIDFEIPYFILFSPDNKLLAAMAYDNIVHLWDISTAAELAKSMVSLTATPDLALIPTPTITPDLIAPLSIQPPTPPTQESGAISPENISSLEMRGELGLGRARVAAWAPDGKTLAIGIPTGAYIFELGVAQPTHFLPADEFLVLLTFSPDGRLLAGQMSNSAIQVWDVPTGRSLYKLENIGCWNQGMTFSSDNQILSAHCGNETYRWSMADGRLLSKDKKNASSPDTSPDGSLRIQVGMTSARLLASDSDEIIKTFDVPDMAPALARFSPDGKTLLVWYYKFDIARSGVYYPGKDPEGLIQLWNILPGQVPTLRTTLVPGKWYPEMLVMLEAFQGLDFAPDGHRVVTASGDGQVQMWDVNSGELLATLPDGRRVYFSHNGKQLISVGKAVQVWDVSQGKQPAVTWNIPGFTEFSPLLMFTGDGDDLVTASSDAFQIWPQNEAAFTEDPTVIEAADTNMNIQSASPDGKWLAYSTLDDLVLGENDPKGSNWQTLEKFADLPYKQSARALTFSPNSLLLAMADPDRKVLLWRLGAPEIKPVELASDNYIADLLFSPDSKMLLGIDNAAQDEATLYLWDTETGKLLRMWKTMGYLFKFHPDGVTLAATNYRTGAIQFIDLRSGNIMREMKGNPYTRDIAFSPDGSLLATASNENIELWNVVTGELLRKINGSFNRLAFSSDGKLLVGSLNDGRIQYWDLPAK